VETNFIDKIRAVPLFEGIDAQSVSTLANDVYQMRELMKAYQQNNNIERLMGIIHGIHETFATKLIPIDITPYKGVTNVRNWMKFLTNIHPIVDSNLRNALEQLPLFKMCFFKDTSEIMAENVILDTSDTTNVDITKWKETSELINNSINKLPKTFSAPSYIRENVRHKLDSSVVRLIQGSNAKLSGCMSGFEKFAPGRPDGTDWCPPEVDVSIRPGWFYHPAEDTKVKTAAKLMEIYYNSVGRGANLLLNLPPDRRGLIHETDAANLREFRRQLDATFKTDLARQAKVTATARRLNGPTYNPDKLNDGKPNTCWATDDGVTTASATLEFKRPARFDRVVIQEYLALGQRVEAWSVEAEVDGQWKAIGTGSTLGYKRILRCEPVTATKVRLNILQARACPMIATLGLYLSP
jgi:hypothetical protein